ncbi:hypothetical protein Taro_021702 [Colocasia esculenta]|uniref:hAT-like transposase RNase-H fold domain-containing protein n=1 Tax=Colocasia esculenta TaxID=4460 RepID=A0A843V667_COLES|nr:hypothetical protein [Colocasia esculenta]
MFTRNIHKEDCIKLYEKVKDKMCKFFNKITFRVTLTADIWTSSNMVSYISLTCHFIDDDWTLQNKILNFLSFEYPHSEWERVKIVKDCLELFYSITKRFSSVKSPTSNLYFNDLCLVNLKLNNWSKHPHLFIVRMAEKMHAKFKKYWDMNNMLLSIASVLDPRYKMKSMEYLYMAIFSNPSEVKEKIDDVCASFEYLYNAYVEQVKKVPRSPHILTHTRNSDSHDTSFGVGGVFELSSCATRCGAIDTLISWLPVSQISLRSIPLLVLIKVVLDLLQGWKQLSLMTDKTLEKISNLTEAPIEAVFTDPTYGKDTYI